MPRPDSGNDTMNYTEQAFLFDCAGCRLTGIASQPEMPADTGILILVGGPQYRAGSHRQFTLLARQLAAQGIAAMRFDYRGMGDSEGDAQTFETVNEDIHAAINAFFVRVPDLRRVAIWGLCDAASSALFYAHTDERVSRLILLNPWVHTEAGAACAQLKYYYLARLTQRAFWTKLLTGKVNLGQSVGDLKQSAQSVVSADNNKPGDLRHGRPGYIERMLHGLQKFQGKTLLVLSGNDLVAQEFIALTQRDKHWKKTCASARITRWMLKAANHTFSSQIWRDEVGKRTIEWLRK